MTEPIQPEDIPERQPEISPTRRDRLRPLELVGFSGVLAVFAGLVVLLVTRDVIRSGIGAGISFIVVVLVLALLGLGGTPSQEDLEARKDLKDPGSDNWH